MTDRQAADSKDSITLLPRSDRTVPTPACVPRLHIPVLEGIGSCQRAFATSTQSDGRDASEMGCNRPGEHCRTLALKPDPHFLPTELMANAYGDSGCYVGLNTGSKSENIP